VLAVSVWQEVRVNRTCRSVGRHLDVYSCRTDGRVSFFVHHSTSNSTKHSSCVTGLSLSVPRARCARLQLKRLRLHHPVLAKTIERVIKAVQRLKVRIAPEYNYNINYYAICFINWNYSSTVSRAGADHPKLPNRGEGVQGGERAPSRDESARYGSKRFYVGVKV